MQAQQWGKLVSMMPCEIHRPLRVEAEVDQFLSKTFASEQLGDRSSKPGGKHHPVGPVSSPSR
jgi:hypothetical protein